MSPREKLLSTLSVLAFGSVVSATPSSAQVQRLDCDFIKSIYSADALREIAHGDPSCGPAAMARIFDLTQSDPQFDPNVDTY
jgi:hypothetical protein